MEKEFTLLPFSPNKDFSIVGHITPHDKFLNCKFLLEGHVSKLKINQTPSQIFMRNKVEGLWNQTCFEIFIKDKNSTHYTEWNFAPTGDWFCINFSDYRERMNPQNIPSPEFIRWNLTKESLSGEFKIPVSRHYEIGISCVLQTRDEEYSYWSLHHYGVKPDFHDFRSFQLSF